jgi:hypothetical protein
MVDPKTDNIPARFELIEDIARQLEQKYLQHTALGCLEVVLYCDDERVCTTDIGQALGYLIGDMWQDRDAVDIRGLDRAEVRVI